MYKFFWYKPTGLKGNKQKMEAVARFLRILHLDVLPPQANLCEARVILSSSIKVIVDLWVGSCIYQIIPKDGIGSCHHPYASFKWTHYGIRNSQRIRLEFPMRSINKVQHLPSHLTRAIPASRTPGQLTPPGLTQVPDNQVGARTLSPRTSATIQAGK